MARIATFADSEVSSSVLEEVRSFVAEAFEGRFSEEDWEHTGGGWRVIAFEGDLPVAHAAVVPRVLWIGDREFRAGYVEGVATRRARQREGVGSAVMADAAQIVRRRFQLGALSTSRRGFYAGLGWQSWRGPSFVRRLDDLERSADEDDGLMVLRFGPSEGIDLSDPIICEGRLGDDW